MWTLFYIDVDTYFVIIPASLEIEPLREYFSSGVSPDILTKRTQLVALWWGVEYKTDAIFTVVTACVMKSQLCSERWHCQQFSTLILRTLFSTELNKMKVWDLWTFLLLCVRLYDKGLLLVAVIQITILPPPSTTTKIKLMKNVYLFLVMIIFK